MSLSDDEILTAMEILGGSFVAALAKAWRRADEGNQAKLRAAFPEYWAHYAELAARRKHGQRVQA